MNDRLDDNDIYRRAMEIYEKFLEDSEILGRDYRGREIVRQLIRSMGSISANIEEGYGRGSRREYVYFLRVARGSARESKGWYIRSKKFLSSAIINERVNELDEIIAMLVSTINKLGKSERRISRPSSLDLRS